MNKELIAQAVGALAHSDELKAQGMHLSAKTWQQLAADLTKEAMK